AYKVANEFVAFALVDADAMLHRDRNRDRIAHGHDAVGHQPRLPHQARDKGAPLHPLAGAPAVEVDLAVTPLLAQPCALRQLGRLAAAELESDGVVLGVENEAPRDVV